MSTSVRFILNGKDVETSVSPGVLVLDYLRESQRLTGTKEGCREGDCGACVVLVGALDGDSVRYRSVTSCLMPIQELHGKHLVTIEGLNRERLSTVQQAIVDEGSSQCGFCTPGIVVSLTGYLMETDQVDAPGIKNSLGGHLCRCTGYRSLKASVDHLYTLETGMEALVASDELPAWFLTIATRLSSIAPLPHPTSNGTVAIAGGTDLYVQQGDHLSQGDVSVLGLRPDLQGIRATETHLHLGPGTTFEELAESDAFGRVVPRIREYMDDIASLQIRNRATIGGNLINASPIGDITILLLALDTSLTLRSAAGSQRSVPLSDFYRGYKQMDRRPDELLVGIAIRIPESGTQISWEKVSKRRTLDIASVNGAMRIRTDRGVIQDVTITCGGVAPVPLLLARTSDGLVGAPLNAATVLKATQTVQSEIAPIGDIRGTADYKRLLARQLLLAHFNNLFPDILSLEALYEEH